MNTTKDILPTGNEPTDYTKCTITDIRRGKGERAIYTYAKLRNERGEVVVNADLDYIVRVFADRLPGKLEHNSNVTSYKCDCCGKDPTTCYCD